MADYPNDSNTQQPDAVDERPPAGKLLTLGLQHVLVMYAGAIAVPLIIGGALKMPKEQIALLINSDLLCCGIITIIQALGVGRFGIRLPVMMGVTFAAVGPMVAMAGNPDYGAPEHLAIAAVVLASVLLITRYGRGFMSNVAVLAGMVIGFFISMAMGKVSFAGLDEAPWMALVLPLQFGMPTFDPVSIATMCLVMVVVMVESLGMFLALGELTGRRLNRDDLTRGLRTDGLGTLVGGFLNTFPHTSFSQNVGLVGVTGVKSRWVCVVGGVILMAFGLFPKMAHVIASVPQFVLGGAGLVMFGMVAATGIKILVGADLRGNRNNLYVVAVSIGMGMIPLVAPTFFHAMPKALEPLLHSGILLAAIAAVGLNVFLNGTGRNGKTAEGAELVRSEEHTSEL